VSTKPSFAIYARCAPPPTPGLDLDAETVVFSNGNGLQPYTVDDLLHLLQTESLAWGEAEVCANGVAVTGNFEHFSHVFNIHTRDQVLATKLVAGVQKASRPGTARPVPERAWACIEGTAGWTAPAPSDLPPVVRPDQRTA